MHPDRHLVIGDVHGCLDELQELLHAADISRISTEVVFAGDYLDRGPFIPEVVKLIRRMVESGQARAVMGNHDLWGLENLARGEPVQFDPADAGFLASLPAAVSLPSGLVFHGGITPYTRIETIIDKPYGLLRGSRRALADQTMTMRAVDWHNQAVPLDSEGAGQPLWNEVYDGRYGWIYFGHTTQARPTPWTVPLDGGCVFGGVLRGAFHGPDGPMGIIEIPAKRKYV